MTECSPKWSETALGLRKGWGMILWYTPHSYVLMYQLSGSATLETEECSRAIQIRTQNTAIKKGTLEPQRSSSAVRPEEAFCGWHGSLLIVLQCVLPKASLLHQVAQGVAARVSTLLLYMSLEDWLNWSSAWLIHYSIRLQVVATSLYLLTYTVQGTCKCSVV